MQAAFSLQSTYSQSKISCLPYEVLAFIFQNFLEIRLEAEYDDVPEDGCEEGDRDPQVYFRPSACALVVSHVCAVWRSVALSSPMLWRTLHIDDSIKMGVVLAQLTWSKELPLKISVDFTQSTSPDVVESVVAHLLSNAHRWQVFSWRSNGVSSPFQTRMITEAPLLEEYCFIVWGPDPVMGGNANIFSGPGSTPRLKDVDLWGSSIDWKDHPFHSLCRLEVGNLMQDSWLTVEQFCQLLRSSPALESLAVYDPVIQPASLAAAFKRSAPPLPPLHNPVLTSLGLHRFDRAKTLNSVLRLFDLTPIQKLTLEDRPTDDAVSLDFTSTFKLLASNPDALQNIEYLKLDQVHVKGRPAPDILFWALVNLKQLHIITVPPYNFDPWIMPGIYHGALVVPEQENVPCPQLEHLKSVGLGGKRLVAIAQVRKRAGAPLNLIEYDATDSLSPEDVRHLEAEGVEALECTESNLYDDDDDLP